MRAAWAVSAVARSTLFGRRRHSMVPHPHASRDGVTPWPPVITVANYSSPEQFGESRRSRPTPLHKARAAAPASAGRPRRGGAAAAAAAVLRATCARGPRADVLAALRARARHHAAKFPPGPHWRMVVRQHGKAIRALRAGVASRRANTFHCSESTRCTCGGATNFSPTCCMWC